MMQQQSVADGKFAASWIGPRWHLCSLKSAADRLPPMGEVVMVWGHDSRCCEHIAFARRAVIGASGNEWAWYEGDSARGIRFMVSHWADRPMTP